MTRGKRFAHHEPPIESIPKDLTALEIITKARALITDPIHWTKKAFGRDANGNSRMWEARDACAFCITGAVFRAELVLLRERGSFAPIRVGVEVINALSEVAGTFSNLVEFNDADNTTHDKVLAVLDCAIENLKADC